jgi:hypothetical protein
VANGRVYVASYQSLTIFGTSGVGGDPPAAHKATFIAPPAPDTTPVQGHRLTGIVRAIDGSRLSIETRDGKTVTVDYQPAAERVATVKPIVGKAVQALGDWDKDSVLQATSLQHAKPAAAIWLPDR